MKSKNFFENELIKIFKKELKIKVSSKSRIYDHENWDFKEILIFY